jgi:hypothetical protein
MIFCQLHGVRWLFSGKAFGRQLPSGFARLIAACVQPGTCLGCSLEGRRTRFTGDPSPGRDNKPPIDRKGNLTMAGDAPG